jgi:ubiquinone/menaquinone biosynthesis C-methylase UbiE
LGALETYAYDVIQRAAGIRRSRDVVARFLGSTDGLVVLDVGAGTGLYTDLAADAASYTAVDVDPEKLGRLRDRAPHAQIVVGDATRLPFEDDSFDVSICIALAHHLPDDGLVLLVQELRRVTRARLLFVDPVWEPGSIRGRGLWMLDRGAYPRTASSLLAALEPAFTLAEVERYSVHHHYVACVATPA